MGTAEVKLLDLSRSGLDTQSEPVTHFEAVGGGDPGPFPGHHLADLANRPHVRLSDLPVDYSVASLLSEHLSRRHHVTAIGWSNGAPIVAVAAPEDLIALDDVRMALGREFVLVVSSPEEIDRHIDALFGENNRVETSIGRDQPFGSDEMSGDAAKSIDHDNTTSIPLPTFDPLNPGALSVRAADGDGAPARLQLPAPEFIGMNYAAIVRWLATGAPPDSIADQIGDIDIEAIVNAHCASPLKRSSTADSSEEESSSELPDGLALALLTTGSITQENLAAALEQQATSGRDLQTIVLESGFVSEAELAPALAVEAGLEFVDLNSWVIDKGAADLVPESLARRHRVLAIGFDEHERPIIAMANPSEVIALDDIRTLLGREVVAVVCPAGQIDDYLARVYRHSEETDLAAQRAASSVLRGLSSSTLNKLQVVAEDAPIVKFVNLILRQALSERASDVHIEPTADSLEVRFRIDGVLHSAHSSSKAIHNLVVSRLKVMADLDIAEHRFPQDGRISLVETDREIDLRVATLPTVHGEKVVLRVLDKSTAPLDLERIGFSPDVLARYEPAYKKSSGTILVTGPTGSGKSTTLYATLNKLNSSERNLITVEDPVEYQLRGVNQVQVNPRSGLGFAGALRSILRSDPDVVLVGEIRDKETAIITVEAALTGHLVLSCLHTNNAASTPLRLVEMGVEPFLVGSALDCVLAQRLGRLLCENCAERYSPSAEELTSVGWDEADAPFEGDLCFRRPVGCQACSHTGYRGRIAIQEVMPVTEEIERAILARAQSQEIQRIAIAEGLRPLRHDGLRKAALGLTSLEELLRVAS